MDNAEFEVEIASTGQVFRVPVDKSILQVLEENNVMVESLSTEGICGTCITPVLAGIPEHRDFVLDAGEQDANERMALCCSRSLSPRLKLDL